ncbi:MAG: YIP1 family protein [Planctomycetota bacterium]
MLCPKCAQTIEDGQAKCPNCGAEIIASEGGLRPPASGPSQNVSPTWDDNGPLFKRLWNTWIATIFRPMTFFSRTPVNAGLGKPLLYAIITGFVGAVGVAFWQVVFTALQIPFFGIQQDKTDEMLPFVITPLLGVVYVVVSPLFITIGVFIWSGILHLCLMIVGGNKKGFEATFRPVTYAQSPMVFNLIPFCGGHIAGLWAMVLTIIGLKETHQIPVWKAIVAYLIPIVLCCVCVVIAIMIIGFGVFAALGQGMQ